jgi:hypothetical protein
LRQLLDRARPALMAIVACAAALGLAWFENARIPVANWLL